MKVGLTGASGFIGSHLVRRLVLEGSRPIVFQLPGADTRAAAGLDDHFDVVLGDVRDAAETEAFVSRCDAVIHLAGYNRYWARDPRVFHETNVIGARNVARACMKHGTERLVHVSSCVTFGASLGPYPRDESSVYNLHEIPFAYAQTKRAGEDEVRWWTRRKGLPAVIVNPASAVGDGDFGPTPIGQAIADIATGRWPVYVGGGACFIDVNDVCRGILAALELGRMGESYLLAGENMLSREFMARVARRAGRLAPFVPLPKRLVRTAAFGAEWISSRVTDKAPPLTRGTSELVGRYLYFDGAKAACELGFKAGPVDAAIARAVDWFTHDARKKENGDANGSRDRSHWLHRWASGAAPLWPRAPRARARAAGKREQTAA